MNTVEVAHQGFQYKANYIKSQNTNTVIVYGENGTEETFQYNGIKEADLAEMLLFNLIRKGNITPC